MIYLKLDGDNILGHDYYQHDEYKYQLNLEVTDIVNDKGKYIYKIVDNKLIEMTQDEYNNHPNIINKEIEKELENLKNIQIQKIALNEVKKIRPDLSDIIDQKIQELENT